MPAREPDTLIGCVVCHHSQDVIFDQIAEDWPSHCGQMMAVVTSSVPREKRLAKLVGRDVGKAVAKATVEVVADELEVMRLGLKQTSEALRNLYHAITPSMHGEMSRQQVSALFDAREVARNLLGLPE